MGIMVKKVTLACVRSKSRRLAVFMASLSVLLVLTGTVIVGSAGLAVPLPGAVELQSSTYDDDGHGDGDTITNLFHHIMALSSSSISISSSGSQRVKRQQQQQQQQQQQTISNDSEPSIPAYRQEPDAQFVAVRDGVGDVSSMSAAGLIDPPRRLPACPYGQERDFLGFCVIVFRTNGRMTSTSNATSNATSTLLLVHTVGVNDTAATADS